MVVCKFFLQGNCRFGGKFADQHVRNCRGRMLSVKQIIAGMSILATVVVGLEVRIASGFWLTPVLATMVSTAACSVRPNRYSCTV
jgi:hypothetical protein